MDMRYLVAYDVTNSKRRRRVAKEVYAVALGGQKSALESVLDERDADRLAERLFVRCKPEEDRIHIVKVMPKAILLGHATQIDFDEGAIIL